MPQTCYDLMNLCNSLNNRTCMRDNMPFCKSADHRPAPLQCMFVYDSLREEPHALAAGKKRRAQDLLESRRDHLKLE